MTTKRAAAVAFAVAAVWLAFTRPALSHPPAWLDRLARGFVREVFPPLFWGLAVACLGGWEVLRWQRRSPETKAARWIRRLILALGVLCLVLAAGQTVLHRWNAVGFAVATLFLAVATYGFIAALVWTYGYPAWRCRGGRCVTVAPPVDAGAILPAPPKVEEWDGSERRSGRERRRNVVG
jgi:hypothetical protein